MPKAILKRIDDRGVLYDALVFCCPGCATFYEQSSGLHMLPVNSDVKQPSWDWDGNLESPTLNPSILTGKGTEHICHSYLKAGVFQFLEDSTHELAGKHVEMGDLPDWVVNE